MGGKYKAPTRLAASLGPAAGFRPNSGGSGSASCTTVATRIRSCGRAGRPAQTSTRREPRHDRRSAERLVVARATGPAEFCEPCNGRSASSSPAVREERYFRAPPGISYYQQSSSRMAHITTSSLASRCFAVRSFIRPSVGPAVFSFDRYVLALFFSSSFSLSLSSIGLFFPSLFVNHCVFTFVVII